MTGQLESWVVPLGFVPIIVIDKNNNQATLLVENWFMLEKPYRQSKQYILSVGQVIQLKTENVRKYYPKLLEEGEYRILEVLPKWIQSGKQSVRKYVVEKI